MTRLARPASTSARPLCALLAFVLLLGLFVAAPPPREADAAPTVEACGSKITGQPLADGDDPPSDCAGSRLLEFSPPIIPTIAFDPVLRFEWPEACTREETQSSPSKCLVNEVLQSAVGNHLRDKVQALPAIRFIESRHTVQKEAFVAIREYLGLYEVETKGVYIQDVTFPEDLVTVLTRREIANQEKATFDEQRRAQTARVEMEKAKGMADMQSQLATSQVDVEIKRNNAAARESDARGQAAFTRLTGEAEAAKVEALGLADAKATEALGLARARGYEEQRKALGEAATALVNAVGQIAAGEVKVVPDVLVMGDGSSLDALAATLVRNLTAPSQPAVASNGAGK